MKEFKSSLIIHSLVLILVVTLIFAGNLEYFEFIVMDNRVKMREPISPSDKIVIIGITENSILELGGWPLARRKYAELVEKLKNSGAIVAGVDIVFENPGKPDEDKFLAETLKSMPTVLPVVHEKRLEIIDSEISDNLIDVIKKPSPSIITKGQKFGFINTAYENSNVDGILRSLPLKIDVNGKIHESFAVSCIRAYLENGNDVNEEIFDRINNLEAGRHYYINNVNNAVDGIALLSFGDFFNGRLTGEKLDFFRDKIVLIGPMATTIGDIHHTALGTVFGIEIHGTIISNILKNGFLTRISKKSSILLIFLILLLLTLIFAVYGVRIYNYVIISVSVIFTIISIILFNYNYLLDAVPFICAIVLSFTIVNFYWLYRKLHLANMTLSRNVNELKALYEISKTIGDIENLESVLCRVLEIAVEILSSQRGSLMIFNEETGKLIVEVIYIRGKEGEERGSIKPEKCIELNPGEGIAGVVFEEKRPAIVNKGSKDPRFKTKKLGDQNVDNLLCVPMMMKDRCIGVINISNKLDGTYFDKTEEKLMEMISHHAATVVENARLYKLATVDGMTGLYVNRYFQIRLREELLRAIRYKKQISVLMTDIDHFKQFNDNYGHQMGDLVLIAVANVVKETVRLSDFPARYGGEEFIVILPETEAEGAYKLGERIRERVEKKKVSTPKGELSVTISVGIATYPDCTVKDADELISLADAALYKAKATGRNKVCAYVAE